MVHVQIIGRLGADAEVKTSKNGKSFISFRIATDEFKNGKNETSWLNVIDLTDKGQKMSPYLKKGTMVNVYGIETVDTYVNKLGETQISRDVVADRIDFVASSKTNQEGEKTNTTDNSANYQDISCGVLARPVPTNNTTVVNEITNDTDIDDLPF